MRQARLHDLVGDLVKDSFDGEDQDVAEAILVDQDDMHGGFAGLCRRLAETVSGDDEDGVRTAWAFLMSQVDDRLKDRIASGEIMQPAIYLGAML